VIKQVNLTDYDYVLLGQIYVQLINSKTINIEYDEFLKIIFKESK